MTRLKAKYKTIYCSNNDPIGTSNRVFAKEEFCPSFGCSTVEFGGATAGAVLASGTLLYIGSLAAGGITGSHGPGAVIGALILIPAAIGGTIYGSAAGVSTTGRLLGDHGTYANATSGAWWGLLGTAVIAITASATMDHDSTAYKFISTGSYLLIPLGSVLSYPSKIVIKQRRLKKRPAISIGGNKESLVVGVS